MRTRTMRAGVAGVVLSLIAMLALAPSASAQTAVPPLVKFSGTVPDARGDVAMTFSLYADQTGNAPALWTETQNVTIDADGRYTVFLGAGQAEGLPTQLFAAGAARWLGVQVAGQPEQPRVLLVSVPYALKAGDADTIGGKPLSSFVLAGNTTGKGADGLTYMNTAAAPGATGVATITGGTAQTSGTAGYIGMFTDSINLGNSVIYQSGTSIGVNTTVPEAAFHAKGSVAPAVLFDVYSNSLTALPGVYRAARGTTASPLALSTGDILGGLAVRGYNGAGFTTGRGQVMFKASEPWSTTANGTYLQIQTTPNGGVSAIERVRVAPNGYVGIGTVPNTPAYPLEIPIQNGNVHAAFGANNNGLFFISNQPQIGFNLTWPQGASHYQLATTGYGGYIAMGQEGTAGMFSIATTINATAGTTVYPTPRLVITADGKVGIGTTSPATLLDVAGDVGGTGATFSDPVTNGTAVSGYCSGASCYGIYGNTTDGQGVRGYSGTGYGVYGNTSSGYAIYGNANNTSAIAGRFNQSNSAGKALSAVVNGTEAMMVDASGVHAGPAMLGTPLASGLINGNPGSELADAHSSNVSAATWTSTGVCDVTISGVSLDYMNYVIVVSQYGSSGGFATSAVNSGHMTVYTFDKNGVAANRSFNFIIMAM